MGGAPVAQRRPRPRRRGATARRARVRAAQQLEATARSHSSTPQLDATARRHSSTPQLDATAASPPVSTRWVRTGLRRKSAVMRPSQPAAVRLVGGRGGDATVRCAHPVADSAGSSDDDGRWLEDNQTSRHMACGYGEGVPCASSTEGHVARTRRWSPLYAPLLYCGRVRIRMLGVARHCR
jgi:hypothetical protein